MADRAGYTHKVSDSLRSYAEADVAFIPGVMIRCSIEKGKLYTLNLYDVLAIGCNLSVRNVTGEELLSRMEEAVAAMGDYLKSGKAVILPDVPIPDNRIVPMEEIPADAVLYEIKSEAENKEDE